MIWNPKPTTKNDAHDQGTSGTEVVRGNGYGRDDDKPQRESHTDALTQENLIVVVGLRDREHEKTASQEDLGQRTQESCRPNVREQIQQRPRDHQKSKVARIVKSSGRQA